VQTVRWRLYEVAGRLVQHARRTVLKVAAGWRLLWQLQQMRAASWQAAFG
jgi:hypothetical protein